MSKKVCLLFLIGAFMAFAATQAWAETVYELVDFDSDGAELFESDDVEIGFFAGGNFYGRYRLPELSIVSYDSEATESKNKIDTDFAVKWTLKSDELTDFVIQSEETDDEGKYLVVSGVLPSADDEKEYDISFVATITEIDENYQSLNGKTAEIEADAIEAAILDEGYTTVATSDMANYGLDGEFNTVTSSYSVTVNALDGRNYNYIESADYGEYTIDLPKWLTCSNVVRDTELNEEDLDDFRDEEGNIVKPITSVTIKFNDEYRGKFKDGSKGIVRITFVDGENEPDAVLSWNVTLSEPIEISAESKNLEFDLTAGGNPVVKTAEYTGASPVSFTQSETITGVTFSITSDDEKITLTATASDSAAATTGTAVTFTFTDAKGKTDTITTTVKVTVPEKPALSVSGTKDLSVTAGESVSTTLTAQGVGGATISTVSWDIVSVPTGLKATMTASTDKSATFLISADETATAGSKTVSIKATDTSDNTLTTTVNLAVTVKAKSAEDMTDSITVKDSSGADSPKPFSKVKPGEKATFTITLPSSIAAKIWTVLINGVASHTVTVSSVTPAADNWVTITNYSATGATVEADVPSSLNADSAISVLVEDANGKEYTADLGTVSKTSDGASSSGSGCDAGFGALTLALAATLFISKKH